jgi:putative glutamine amidotransferase
MSITPAANGRPERTTLNSAYLRAVEGAGGVPVMIAPGFDDGTIRELMANSSGLVLTGGGDVDPALYGEAPNGTQMDSVSPERDTMEVAALRIALERGLPVLAVCRGMQVLNVGLGGSLYQDLPSQWASDIIHTQTAGGEHARDEATHRVRVEAGTCLASILGGTDVRVNSMHHQALRALGRGVTAAAWAPDGVIEGVEMPGEHWVLGVQWHPEELIAGHEHARRLFAGFVAACGPRS